MKFSVKLRHQWESYQEIEIEADNATKAVELALEKAAPAVSHDEGGIDHCDVDYWDHEEID